MEALVWLVSCGVGGAYFVYQVLNFVITLFTDVIVKFSVPVHSATNDALLSHRKGE